MMKLPGHGTCFVGISLTTDSISFIVVDNSGILLILFFKGFVYLFRERGREGEREGDKHQCVVAPHVFPTGDLARNPGMCPDWESNQRPYGLQALSPLSHTSQGYSIYFLFPCFYFDSVNWLLHFEKSTLLKYNLYTINTSMLTVQVNEF